MADTLQRVRVMLADRIGRELEYNRQLDRAEMDALTRWAHKTYGVPVLLLFDVIPESQSASRAFAWLLAEE